MWRGSEISIGKNRTKLADRHFIPMPHQEIVYCRLETPSLFVIAQLG